MSLDNEEIEHRLAAVEAALCQVQEKLGIASATSNWVERLSGSLADIPDDDYQQFLDCCRDVRIGSGNANSEAADIREQFCNLAMKAGGDVLAVQFVVLVTFRYAAVGPMDYDDFRFRIDHPHQCNTSDEVLFDFHIEFGRLFLLRNHLPPQDRARSTGSLPSNARRKIAHA